MKVCEHLTLTIACSNNKRIHIKEALYGRLTRNDNCGSGNINCRSSNSLKEVRERCENKQKCSVAASNSVFGDPCGMTVKSLTVDFECKTECEYCV